MALSRVVTLNGVIEFELSGWRRDLGKQSIVMHEDSVDGSWLIYRSDAELNEETGDVERPAHIRVIDSAAIMLITTLVDLLDGGEGSHTI